MKGKMFVIFLVLLLNVSILTVNGIRNNNTESPFENNIMNYELWLESDKLLASDGAYWDVFGYSVCINGDYAIVGAVLDDDNGNNSGSAYIYKYNGVNWSQQAKLVASDGDVADEFGYAVSINGNYAFVGAPYRSDGGSSGVVYVFERNGETWIETQKLVASDGGGWFGYSVSIDGQYAIIGARQGNGGSSNTGTAYVFKLVYSSWIEQQELAASDGMHDDMFGESVSINGYYAIVGAPQGDIEGLQTGSAYIFKRNGETWTETQELEFSDLEEHAVFGNSVSIYGDYAVVGAYQGDGNEDNAGSAYVYKRNAETWTEEQKLVASDGDSGDLFGWSTCIYENDIVVGAWREWGETGAAYVYKREEKGWNEKQKLTASDGEGDDYFGFYVSIDGDHIISGAWGDEDYGWRSGAAYIFKRTEQPDIPDLECSGYLSWDNVKSGTRVTDYFSIENIGDSGSLLNWKIDSYPNWGTDWTFTPASGTGLTPEDGEINVIVEFNAPSDLNMEFYGSIVIVNENDASDYCEIDIYLQTPRYRATFNPSFYWFLERFPLLERLIGLLL